MSIPIALTEDNAINRNTFMQKLSQVEGYHLVFVAKDGNDCLDNLKGLPLQQMPRVIFMDIEMPHMDGIETIRIGKTLYPEIHFIVLTVFDDDEKIFDAVRAGASGYLLKHEPASVLKEALTNVLEYGGAPMSPAIARKALRLLSNPSSQTISQTQSIPETISEREKEVLQQMVLGRDAKRIAQELNVAVETVRKHIAHIYKKLHVNSKAQVISLAHKNKWL